MVALLGMTLLMYQITPKSVLARDTFIGRIQPLMLMVRLADRSLNTFYRGPTPPAEVPFYSIEIDDADLTLLEEKLEKLDVFLEDDAKIWMDITFTADGEKYDAKMRVRGDRFNHWQFRKKSWRVKFPKDHLFRGMREMTLIIPEDRAWHAEMVSYHRAKKLELLQPPMQFVGVSMNGSAPLAYVEVEHWTKEMLEKQGYPGDVNFYNPGGTQTSTFDGWDPLYEDLEYSGKYLESDISPQDSFEQLELLFSLEEEGAYLEPDFQAKVLSIFDFDTLIKWHAQSFLAGNLHAGGANMRVFFDTSRGQFVPVPWDIHITTPKPLLSQYPSALWQNIFAIPEWNLALHQFLWEYLSSEEQVGDDLVYIDSYREMVEEMAYRDPHKLLSNRQIKNDLDRRSRELRENMDSLREQLQTSELLVAQRLPTDDDLADGIGLILDITMRGPVASILTNVTLPSEIELDISLDGEEFILGETLLAPESPPVDDLGFPTETPQTHYLLELRGFTITAGDLPLPLDLRNAVTGEPSDVINTVVVDDSRYQDFVPDLR